MMSNNGSTKKRRVGGGGARVSINGGGESGGGSELATIKSMMQELIQQNRTQTNIINNMQAEITLISNKCNMLEQACKNTVTLNANMTRRFDAVDEKLKYHDILLQNQGWKYSAPSPSAEYWSTLNENEKRVAKDFLRQIQYCTEDMRNCQGDGVFVLNVNSDLPYNEVFLPHWKEFANALIQYHYHLKNTSEQRKESKTKLCLVDLELPNEVVDLLSNGLESTHFSNFGLKGNNFGQKGIEFALKYLMSNPILKTFSLVDNPINMGDIERLYEIVKNHPSIKRLYLIRCRGTNLEGYDMLTRIMNAGRDKLEEIYLSNNNISTVKGTFISNFLATNPCLRTLDLMGNKLDDNDAVNIARSLKHNADLRFLRLTHNNFTKTGWAALRKAEFDDTSLNAASVCNHSCNITYPPDGSDEIEGLDIIEMNGNRKGSVSFGSKCVRQKKIYSILSTRNRDCSNVKHFEKVPVEILPNMLHSIQKCSSYRDEEDDIIQVRDHAQSLSIVYEVCRHWDESLAAFEALSS